MIKYFKVLTVFFLVAQFTPALAETAYIKDTLRWSLRAEPNKASQSLRLVVSGMKVKKLADANNNVVNFFIRVLKKLIT